MKNEKQLKLNQLLKLFKKLVKLRDETISTSSRAKAVADLAIKENVLCQMDVELLWKKVSEVKK